MILFHTTTAEAAASILADGFRGASGSYGFAESWFVDVVFLAVDPATVSDGAKGETVLRVDVGDLDVSDYGIEERGQVWEYLVPAAVLRDLPEGAVTLLACHNRVTGAGD